MKNFGIALRMLFFMTLLTGVAYPLFVTGVANLLFFEKANGSLIRSSKGVVGSELIGQKFTSERFFWSRPSAVDNQPLPSGGSNLSQASRELKKNFDERSANLQRQNPQAGIPPQDLLFASASGLDPHISKASAEYQIERVAKTRGLDAGALRKIVNELTEPRQFGIFGEPRVNVLRLNLALEGLEKLGAK